MNFYKACCILTLMMTGESLGLPAAPLFALPLVPLMKFFTGNRLPAKGFSLLLIPCAAVTAVVPLARFAPLIGLEGLQKTPLWVVMGVTAAVAVFLAFGKAEGLGKWAAVSLPFIAAFLLFTALLLAGKFQYAGIYIPRGWRENPVVLACEAVTILGVIPALGYRERPFRTYLIALLIAFVLGAACWAMANFTLGADLALKTEFPFFSALRIAKGGELIGRVETLLIPVSFSLTIVKTAASLNAASHAYLTLNVRPCK